MSTLGTDMPNGLEVADDDDADDETVKIFDDED